MSLWSCELGAGDTYDIVDRGLSLPRDAISVVCEFWLRVGEYHPGTNALIHFC